MGALAELAGDENTGEHSRTFVLQDEGHTLGNALKSIISHYPEVRFCGYTIPHPAENKMQFRIQALQEFRAIDILKQGFEDLYKLCEHTIETFENTLPNSCAQQLNEAGLEGYASTFLERKLS